MTPSNCENLSALVDGELQREQMRFVLRNLDHDVGLRETWTRYHVIRDGLRRQVPLLASDAFAARVMDAIGQAPDAIVHGRRRWLHWSAGGAIAAGVAAVALMVAQPPGAPSQAPATAELAMPTAARQTAALQPATAPTVPRWLSATPSAAQLAQPAAATFYPGGPEFAPAGYSHQLPSYMMVPSYRNSQMRQARDAAAPPRWLAAPQAAESQQSRQALRLH